MRLAVTVTALGLACAGAAHAGAPDPAPEAADSLVVHASNHMMEHRVPVPRRLRNVKVRHVDQFKLADRQGFKRVSDLVAFPAFYPSLGIMMVRPEPRPIGPFRCFDRAGNLVSTVYMPLLSDMNSHKTWDKVKGLPAPVDHVTIYFHPGHAGVNVPHYHVVLWHVRDENVVAK